MKINKQEFQLGEVAEVILDSQDNDGLIFVPKNIELKLTIENYFGKILINTIDIYTRENELQLSKSGIEQKLVNLDIKLLDRYLFKSLSDKSGIAYSPYHYFPEYDFSVFEKNLLYFSFTIISVQICQISGFFIFSLLNSGPFGL